MLTYTSPLQRVLFHPVRDANPFFHVLEALWMLAGQNKVQPLSYFVKRMEEFSDEDLTKGEIPYRGRASTTTDFTGGYMWGAYGYRWRNWFKYDQIEECISILRHDRITRRVVLEMWSPQDLHRVETHPECKDVPCNLLVMFSPRPAADGEAVGFHVGQEPSPREEERLVPVQGCQDSVEMVRRIIDVDEIAGETGLAILDMTVVNRSNDTLWGALGSNYVHFSFLHEYIANSVGMAVGHYHQITNNLHVYTSDQRDGGRWSGQFDADDLVMDSANGYFPDYRHYPLFRAPINDLEIVDKNREQFDRDCITIFNNLEMLYHPDKSLPLESTYFRDVVWPMLLAYQAFKQKKFTDAMHFANRILPIDWRTACDQWLRRRAAKYTKSMDDGAQP